MPVWQAAAIKKARRCGPFFRQTAYLSMTMSMTRAMRALPAPMSAMVAVTMPALGAIAGSGMLPTLAIDIAVVHITAMDKRPDVMVIMMRRRHADADTDTGGSQRGHGKGGGGETQHGKKMLGGFHGQSFLINGDYIPSNGPDQPRLTNHLYGFVSAWPKRGHNTLQRCLFQAALHYSA